MKRTPLSLLAWLCLLMVAAYALIAAAAALGLVGADWNRIGAQAYAAPSPEHWLGTNRNGQDILSRTLQATRAAFSVGLVAAIASTVLGLLLGAMAGFFGGVIDALVNWLAGVFDSIPFYLLAIALAFALRGHDAAVVLAMIASFWTATARLVRTELRRLRHEGFIDTARLSGLAERQILFSQLLPQCAHLALVQASLAFVAAIKTEALLSFLGLGSGNGVSWGLMLAQSAEEIVSGHYGNFIAATAALSLLALSLGLLADELQRRFDARGNTA
jgi:ABC-type dipeptide/oligopeptide/nickel transport system permease subunit